MQAVERILVAIGHYSQLDKNQENEMALQELKLAVHQLQANDAELQRLRASLAEAAGTLERELLPALEDKEPMTELIDGFRAVAASERTPNESMLRVLIDPAEQNKFERFVDMNTMLVFMAGCAIRERMSVVRDYRAKAAQGLKAAGYLLPDEELIVRDYCRLIALCEQSTADDVQDSFEAIVERIFSE